MCQGVAIIGLGVTETVQGGKAVSVPYIDIEKIKKKKEKDKVDENNPPRLSIPDVAIDAKPNEKHLIVPHLWDFTTNEKVQAVTYDIKN